MRSLLHSKGHLYLLLISTFISVLSHAQQRTDFSQAANRDAGYTPGTVHWIGSILQSGNSRYSEGMSVLQRLIIKDINETAGNVHTVKFNVQATKADNHAYDFLTSWEQALAYAATVGTDLLTSPIAVCGPEPGSDPQGYLTACANAHAGFNVYANQTNAITDPIATTGGVNTKRLAYNAAYPQSTGPVRIWSTSAISAASLTFDGYDGGAGNQLAMYTVTFTTAAHSDVVLEFAGHLSIGRTGYGAGLGAGGINGGPYHFKLASIDGTAGSEDNQITSDDIIVPPTCDLEGPTFACLSTTSLVYSANADVENGAVTYSWSLLNNTAGAQFSGGVVNPTTASVTVVPTGATFTPGGSFNIRVIVSRGGISHTCYLNSETSPGDLVRISNLNAAPTATPATINLVNSTTSQLHANPTGGSTPYSYSWSTSPANGSLNNHTIENPVFTTTVAGTYNYNVTVTDDDNCTVTKPVTIRATLQGADPCVVNGPNAVCQNTQNIPYTLTWTNPGGYTTQWSITGSGAFDPVPGADDATVYVDAGSSGSFTVRFTWVSPSGLDRGFCEKTTTINPNPTATTASQRRCSSTSTATFNLTALDATVINGQTGVAVSWFTNSGLTIPVSDPGSFVSATGPVYAKVTNTTTQCSAYVQVNLYVDPNPVLVINDPESVCRPATVDLTAAAVTAGSTLQGGTLSYWVNPEATIALGNPNAVTQSGTYFIKVTTTYNCTDIEPVDVSITDCGNVFYSLTQGFYGNWGGKACTPDGLKTTAELYDYLLTAAGGSITVGSDERTLSVYRDATQHGAASVGADIAGVVAAMPGGGKSVALPIGVNYTSAIPSSLLKNGKFNNTLLSQTLTLSFNSFISPNLNGFKLESGVDLYSVTEAPGEDCNSETAMTCLQGNPYKVVGRLNAAVVGYLKSVTPLGGLANEATVDELIWFANYALGGQALPKFPAVTGTQITMDMIASAEDMINNVFDQGQIFVGYGTPNAPVCPIIITTLLSSDAVLMGNVVRDNVGEVVELAATAYPNPARGQVSFKVASPVSGNATIQIMTIDGKLLHNSVRFMQAKQTIVVPVSVSARGQLIYRISVGGRTINGKLSNF